MMAQLAEALDTTTSGPSLPMRDAMMIAWKKECYRSSATTSVFGITPTFIWPGTKGAGRLAIVRRYLASMRETVRTILDRKPKTVIMLNQPPFLVAAALVARRKHKFNMILDFHSGALSKAAWKPFIPMYRRVVREAPFVIAHNRFDGRDLSRWGGHPVHFIALPRRFPGNLRERTADPDRILVVCSFADDEPIEALFAAMRACPDIRFEVTGRYQKAGDAIQPVPGNVTLLGFVDYDFYLERFATATAAATFSTRSHIMQMAVHEAISLGVPVVTNESETLAEVLEDAGVYCSIDPDGIANAFRRAIAERDSLRPRARALMERRNTTLAAELAQLAKRAPEMFAQ